MKQCVLIILGSGYLARFVPSLKDYYADVHYSSRDPNHNLAWVPSHKRLRFDLGQRDTWSNIPSGSDLLWCFPAAPVDTVREFATLIKGSFGRLVVLGSTSAYDVAESPKYPPPLIDESASIDLSKPRVQGEELLRKECGAVILRVSGIYGPNRNPLDWIRIGRVRPSRKYVNLIHVEDLAALCVAALKRGRRGEVYNISDGTPRTWNEIYMIGRDRWRLPEIHEQSTQQYGKRIDTRKLRDELGQSLQHSDLFVSLDRLERGPITTAEEPARQDKPADC